MIDHTAAHLALRARLKTTSVATTGTTSIAATTTGYTRAAGSFVTDGFRPGMELLASGFATAGNNGYKVVDEVSALTLTVTSLVAMSVEAAGGNEVLAVGLPGIKAWELIRTSPSPSRPYIEEDYVPAPPVLRTVTADGGHTEDPGLYVIRWYGLAGRSFESIRDCVTAVLERFTPGTAITAGSDALIVRGDSGPWASQILPNGDSWAVSTITIPFRAYTGNQVAA